MAALTTAEITALDHCGPVEAKTKIGTRISALEAGTGAAYGAAGAMAAAGVAAANAAGVATTAARIDHVHAMPYSAVKTAIGAASSELGLNSQKITGLATGTAATDAANVGNVTTAFAGVTGAVKATKTITFAAFAALTTEDTAAVDFDAALPANARVIGHDIIVTTPFNDGTGNPTVTAAVGASGGDADSIVTAYNVAHDGVSGPGTSGVLGYPMASASAVTPAVTFVTNNAAHLVGLDAGSITVNVFYIVLA